MNLETKDEAIKLLKRFSKKWTEVNALHEIWFYMMHGFKYGTDENIDPNINQMYKKVPMFFTISRVAIEGTSRIELVKFFEGNDKATLKYLREYFDKNSNEIFADKSKISEILKINENFKNNMDKFLDTINSLKEIRHKHLAHNDLDYFDDPGQVYKENPIVIDNIFLIINEIKIYLEKIGEHLETVVCPIHIELMDIESLTMYFR